MIFRLLGPEDGEYGSNHRDVVTGYPPRRISRRGAVRAGDWGIASRCVPRGRESKFFEVSICCCRRWDAGRAASQLLRSFDPICQIWGTNKPFKSARSNSSLAASQQRVRADRYLAALKRQHVNASEGLGRARG